jgi:hypothetical protein
LCRPKPKRDIFPPPRFLFRQGNPSHTVPAFYGKEDIEKGNMAGIKAWVEEHETDSHWN